MACYDFSECFMVKTGPSPGSNNELSPDTIPALLHLELHKEILKKDAEGLNKFKGMQETLSNIKAQTKSAATGVAELALRIDGIDKILSKRRVSPNLHYIGPLPV
jgi:hypothetical protein